MVGLIGNLVQSLRKLAFSTGSQQSLIVIIGSLAATGLSAVSLILISRILGPEKFGEFSVGLAIALMLNRVSDMGLAFAVQRYASSSVDKQEQARIVSYVTKVKIISVVVVAIFGVISYQWITAILNFTNPDIVLIAFLLQSFTVLYEHLQSALQAFHRFWQLVIINVIQSSTKLIGVLVFLVTGLYSSFELLSLYLIAPLLPVLAFSKWLPTEITINLSESFHREKKLMTNMAKHSAVMFVSAGVIENIDVLFVQRYLNTYEAGVLSGMSRISLLFMIIAFSLGNVLNPRVARYKEISHLRQFMKKSWFVVIVSCIGFLMTLLIAKYLILFTIGPQYLSGLPILHILLASSFIAIATIPFIAIFFSVEAPWYFSVIGIVQLLITLGGNVIFLPDHGLPAVAWTRLIAKVIAFIVTVVLAKRMIDKQYGTST